MPRIMQGTNRAGHIDSGNAPTWDGAPGARRARRAPGSSGGAASARDREPADQLVELLGGAGEVRRTRGDLLRRRARLLRRRGDLLGRCRRLLGDRRQEIIRFTPPRARSSADPWVRGVISLRCEIVPVYDLASGCTPSRRPTRRS
jgi:hypothetical protein